MLRQNLYISNSQVDQKGASALKNVNFVLIRHVQTVKQDILAIKTIALKNIRVGAKTEMTSL